MGGQCPGGSRPSSESEGPGFSLVPFTQSSAAQSSPIKGPPRKSGGAHESCHLYRAQSPGSRAAFPTAGRLRSGPALPWAAGRVMSAALPANPVPWQGPMGGPGREEQREAGRTLTSASYP